MTIEPTESSVDLAAYLESRRRPVEAALERLLPAAEGPARTVAAAMRYAVLGGGKRLRPILALACCEACGGDSAIAVEPAAAVELLHTYSLVHDDLPAMDDDDLRRGRPTAHRVFGEAVAILAGDALHTLAFAVLATRPFGDASCERRLAAVATVAARAGVAGMVGGQMADLDAEREPVPAEGLEWIHRHKTAALLAASAELGAIHAGAAPPLRAALAEFGEALGMAFQIADDVLDCTATADELGKTPGKDRRAGKSTYPGLFGLEGARKRAEDWLGRALVALERAGVDHPPLAALARHAVTRKH